MRKVLKSEGAGHCRNTGVNRPELYMSREHFALKTEEVECPCWSSGHTHTLSKRHCVCRYSEQNGQRRTHSTAAYKISTYSPKPAYTVY